MRTGIALVAGGFAIGTSGALSPSSTIVLDMILALVLTLLGGAVFVYALYNYQNAFCQIDVNYKTKKRYRFFLALTALLLGITAVILFSVLMKGGVL